MRFALQGRDHVRDPMPPLQSAPQLRASRCIDAPIVGKSPLKPHVPLKPSLVDGAKAFNAIDTELVGTKSD